MAKTIFVIVMGVAIVGLSVWMWWFDNCGSSKKDESSDEKKDL